MDTRTNHTSADQLVCQHEDGGKWSIIISCRVTARIATPKLQFRSQFLNWLDNVGFGSIPAAETPSIKTLLGPAIRAPVHLSSKLEEVTFY